MADSRRAIGVALAALAVAGGTVGCSSSDGSSGDSGGAYTIWDPYPQFDNGSDRGELLADCGAIYLSLGLLNTLPGLVVADDTIAIPFGVIVFQAFMSGIPEEVIQAATVDGAGPLRMFWSVVLPISRNATITVGLFAFLWAWSDFVFASALDGGGRLRPITLGIYQYIGNNNQQWNAIMATAVVASIPAAALLVVAQRYIATGVTTGAVKD
ncbi:hypothetical protein GCM10022225_50510 [Plantactinospora mayteni]|uniref:ABC transmembrane type-1 domain-containing protein n=1 Tax=Plantactinospora mayteni TaxID=566021 RepID=A0ABQ4EY24_9ACTN|nr:hypothetical protein Pma05_61220 [Plantactinospora mayteni]